MSINFNKNFDSIYINQKLYYMYENTALNQAFLKFIIEKKSSSSNKW